MNNPPHIACIAEVSKLKPVGTDFTGCLILLIKFYWNTAMFTAALPVAVFTPQWQS
jgi:hypothetical protein